MTDKTNLGNRMKAYEGVERYVLPLRSPIIIRLDGRAFHTYTKGFERPFDFRITEAMQAAAKAVMNDAQGAEIAYVQSDEISILLNNYKRFSTTPWFDNKIQKICSISAAIATAAFNDFMRNLPHERQIEGVTNTRIALFDSRCFTLPERDVNNYFVWRQRDCIKNSISMFAQSVFSHKKLHKKNSTDKMRMLEDAGRFWDDLPLMCQRGVCAVRVKTEKNGAIRSKVVSDEMIPLFAHDKEYIEQYLEVIEG